MSQPMMKGMFIKIIDHFRPNESIKSKLTSIMVQEKQKTSKNAKYYSPVIIPDAKLPNGRKRYSMLPIHEAWTAVIVRNSLLFGPFGIPVIAGITIVGITSTKPVSMEWRL